MGFECFLELKEREALKSHKNLSSCCTHGKGIKGILIFLIVIAIFNILFGIASKVTSFLNRVNNLISKQENENYKNTEINTEKSEGEYTSFGIKPLRRYKLIVNSIIISHSNLFFIFRICNI